MFIGTHTDRSYADGPTARFTINGKHVTVASVTEATATPRTPDKVIIRSKEYPQFEGSVRLLDVYERYGVLPLEDPSGLRKSAEWDKVAERIEEDVKPKSPATFLTGFAYLLNSYFVHNGRFDGPVITNGFDCSIYGNIQIGGGISSSSATVISMALALLAANNIKVLPPGEEADPKKLEISITDLKEIIGFAEWVAGTRGGTGDHGVIMYGDMGGIVHMWPDGRSQVLYLPSGMQQFLVQTPSRRYNPTLGEDTDEAGGTADARTVNRVYSYTLGYFLLRAKGSQITGDERFNQITCLADIVTLGIPPATVLEAFKALPDRVTREDIQGYIDDGVFSELPKGDLDNLMTYLENDSAWDSEGGICRVRRVTLSQTADLYRVIERFPQILKNTSLTDAEKNTAIRHLSEAVASSQRTQDYPDGTPATWNIDEITDDMLDEAIAGLEQGSINPKTQRQWDIAELPGLESYGVSSAYMDNMVDFIKEGLGEDADKFFAFMEGAGLGGSMLVFAAPDVVDKVKELYQRYAEENFNPGDISFEPMPTGRGAEAFVPPQAQAAARGATLDETVRRARERAAAIAAEQAAITERERVGIANIADRVVFGKDVKGFQGDFADSQFSGIQVPVDISTAVLLSVGITADSGLGVLEANIKGLPVGLLVKTEEQKRRIIALFPEVNPETVVSLEATNGNLNDAIGIALAALSRVYPNITSATYYFDEKTEQAAESSSFTFVDRTVNLSSYGLGIAEIRANLFQLFVGMGVPIGEITPADLATYDKAAALAQSI
jgi:mevalonate kinase